MSDCRHAQTISPTMEPASAGSKWLSVVVPTHNHAEYLPRTIASVLSQANADVELIVVDDGSTDDTSEVLSSYGDAVVVLRQPGRGPGAARNAGAEIAGGDDLLFLDADDELLPGAIAGFRAVRSAHPHAGVLLARHVSRSPSRGDHTSGRVPLGMSRRDAFLAFVLRKFSMAHGSVVVSADAFRKFGYPTEFRNGEDIVLHAQLLATTDMAVLDTATVAVHDHPGRLRHSADGLQSSVAQSVAALFEHPAMPAEFHQFRNQFAACRHLSSGRLLLKNRQYASAATAYRLAYAADPRAVLRIKHCRRWAITRWMAMFARNH